MILVTGSLAFDLIMDFPGKFSDSIDPKKLHILNISFLVSDLKQERGGTAGNIAYSLGLLKMPVGVLGTAGEDFTSYFEFLKKAGVNTANIRVIKKEKTAMAFIITDQKDNQITGFYPGAMKDADKLSIKKLGSKPEFVVIAPDNPKAMINYALECQSLKIPYMFDPGMQLPRLSDKEITQGIEKAEILIGNDYEIGLIKTRLNLNDQQLLTRVKILIITLGELGSMIKTKGEEYKIKVAKPKKVLDPTGCGDAYRSGFLAGYLKKRALKTCGQMGALASCYTVEKYGTNNHHFTLEQFTRRYKTNFNEKI